MSCYSVGKTRSPPNPFPPKTLLLKPKPLTPLSPASPTTSAANEMPPSARLFLSILFFSVRFCFVLLYSVLFYSVEEQSMLLEAESVESRERACGSGFTMYNVRMSSRFYPGFCTSPAAEWQALLAKRRCCLMCAHMIWRKR